MTIMNRCDQTRRTILNHDWTTASLQSAADLLAHLNQCTECSTAVEEFDRLRATLSTDTALHQFTVSQNDLENNLKKFEDNLLKKLGGNPTLALTGQSCETLKERTLEESIALPVPQVSSTRIALWSAIAASLGLAVAGWSLYFNSLHPTVTVASKLGGPFHTQSTLVPAAPPELTEEQIQNAVQLYREVSEVVESPVGWVAFTDNTSELSLVDPALGEAKSLSMLRLSMTRDGKRVLATDVVMRAGQVVDFRIPLEGEQSLHYLISLSSTSSPRLKIAADLTDTRHGAAPLASLVTQLTPQDSVTIPAGRLDTSTGSYELAMAFAGPRE